MTADTNEGNAAEIVRVRDLIPDILVDLKYATADNFTGRVIYDFNEAYLRRGTAVKLAAAQMEAVRSGCTLVIWDALRPVRAQYALWEICPDPYYVADPYRGISSHSRGNTVDVTLATAGGELMPMPSQFDDFSPRANRDYTDCKAEEAANARFLEYIMQKNGFLAYEAEWWHFTDTDSYESTDFFKP